jgi:multiple sugar transport system substrate-binding protein
MKKVLATILSISIAVASLSLSGCSSNKSSASSNAGQQSTQKTKVNFWYLWTGSDAKAVESVISDYNKSQNKYEVVGLSTPDQQKIITAISGGKGPDLSDSFGSTITQYAHDNIAMSLDTLMSKNGVKETDYNQSAINQQKYQGKIYALPVSLNIYALYYNKDLLKAAGITTLPKNLEELNEMADKTTKVSNGTMTQMGAPFVTNQYWYHCYTYALGDNFGNADGSQLTPDTKGFRTALNYLASTVKKYGKNAVNSFITSGDAKEYTGQDPFCLGKQVFRIDGPWFYNMAKDVKVNFGLTAIPGSSSVGGDGYTLLDTSDFYIPSNAKNSDGAFDFMKYITDGAGAKTYVTKKGDLPALNSLINDSSIAGMSESFKVYLGIVKKNHMTPLPSFANVSQYKQDIRAAVGAVALGTSVDDAVAKLKQQTTDLSK